MLTKIPPVHPGDILKENLEELEISEYRLAKDISVHPKTINEIVHGKRSVSANIALRLGRFFNMDSQFWLNLQSRYDLKIAKDKLSDKLDKEVKPYQKAA
ncbi:MAG: HigA family addiction module antidote protein [Candidatus Riflebacteria bacterium]|nr:HigA family addiction module antidote protein [Candidatus Riflebacteria bacterium]